VSEAAVAGQYDPPDEVLPDGRRIPGHGSDRRYKHHTYPCHCVACRAAHAAEQAARRRRARRQTRPRDYVDHIGTPITGGRINIEVDDDLAAEMNAEMERYGITKTELTRRLLREALARRQFLRERGEAP